MQLMKLSIDRYWLAAASLILVALVAGCNSGSSNSSDRNLMAGVFQPDDGLTLTADPSEIVIDLGDPGSPTDPGSGKRYEETNLTAVVLDLDMNPVFEAEVVFATTAGELASGGAPVLTDDQGMAGDTLRVFEDDPDEIEVTATSGEMSETITITKSLLVPNRPPVADAGEDIVIDCVPNEDSVVTLDGSGSTDPDSTPDTHDDIVLFEWFEDFGLPTETALGEGETLDVTFDVGVHTVTLRVTDSEGETSTDDVIVDVQDNTPPVVELMVDPDMIWPPNHKMVDIHATVGVTDCSPVTIALVSVTSNEPDNDIGDGNHEPDVMGVDEGAEDYDFQVRAERAGPGAGRVYTVVYLVTDAGGLETWATAYVEVPHDQGP
jgi:hypothetical protein